MEEKERLEEIEPLLSGNKVLRIRRRKPRARLRIIPNIPGVLRFFGDVALKTPLIPLLLALIVLWLLSSWGLYLAERSVNEQISSYTYALWWSFTAMQTQGANAPGPITTAGLIGDALPGNLSVPSSIIWRNWKSYPSVNWKRLKKPQ
jgi:hypothetical protein